MGLAADGPLPARFGRLIANSKVRAEERVAFCHLYGRYPLPHWVFVGLGSGAKMSVVMSKSLVTMQDKMAEGAALFRPTGVLSWAFGPEERLSMNAHVAVDEAMLGLDGLVDRAACGEEIVILKDGVPCVKLVGAAGVGVKRKPANALEVSFIPDDFNALDEEIFRMFARDCG